MDHEDYLVQAIREAAKGMKSGDGGPFGALIVLHGKIIGRGHNRVLATHDPTAHAEVNAIRDACARLRTHHLTGAVLYSNFEPCPMCLAAIYWADIRSVYFSASLDEADRAGFMDKRLFRELAMPAASREISSTRINMKEMEQLLEEWDGMEGKITY
jgi:guanine deaminase